jgi:hypothetical protein
MSVNRQWACSLCGKRCTTPRGVEMHAADVHKKPAVAVRKPPKRDDDEESYADRAIQAEIDLAAGIYNPDQDWLLP